MQVDFRDHQHVKSRGSQYYHVGPRWEQVKEILDFLSNKRRMEKDSQRKKELDSMIEAQRLRIFQMIRGAIYKEDSTLGNLFDTGCTEFRKNKVSRVVGLLRSNPKEAFRKLSARMSNQS